MKSGSLNLLEHSGPVQWLLYHFNEICCQSPDGNKRFLAIFTQCFAQNIRHFHNAIQANVALDARWSHLNKKTVTLCSVDFTDWAKGITNDTLVFEWGDKTLYTEWIKNQRAGFPPSVTAFEANLFHSWLWRRKLQSLMFCFRVTLGVEMAQSALWLDYGLNYRRIVIHFPGLRERFVFSEIFRPSLGPAQPPEGNETPSLG